MTLERIGPYRIVRLLGKGGMGAVYEGFHEAIERRVAIKVLHSELGLRADIAARFFNETREQNLRQRTINIERRGTSAESGTYAVTHFDGSSKSMVVFMAFAKPQPGRVAFS